MDGKQFSYNMWEDDGWNSNEQFYSPNEMTSIDDNLKFHHNEYDVKSDTTRSDFYSGIVLSNSPFLYGPPSQIGQKVTYERGNSEFEELPLLEELEIYPDQILQNIKVVLDPFRYNVSCDCDLGGPLLFYVCLAFFMFLSGGKCNFGYVYGISVIGCIMIYFLLKVMTDCDKITLMAVASVLGYSILPVVLFSAFGILFSLENVFGYVMALITICWASFAASKIFCILTDNYSQRPLIMYPCALLYGVFILLVIF